MKVVTAQHATLIQGQNFYTFMRVTQTIAPASILGPLTQNGLTIKLVLILYFTNMFTQIHSGEHSSTIFLSALAEQINAKSQSKTNLIRQCGQGLGGA